MEIDFRGKRRCSPRSSALAVPCLQTFSAFQAALLLLSPGGCRYVVVWARNKGCCTDTATLQGQQRARAAACCYRHTGVTERNITSRGINGKLEGNLPASLPPPLAPRGWEGCSPSSPAAHRPPDHPHFPTVPTAPSRRMELTSAPCSALPTYFPAWAVGNDQKHEG